ncbi:MAG: hypothetical protein WCU00_02555 [Candidatus Latescibacterota bacterium]
MRSINILSIVIILALTSPSVQAQDRTFLFTFTSPELSGQPMSFTYGSAYGRETIEPFGSNGVEQNIGLQARMGKSVAFIGHAGLAFDKKTTNASQYGELITHLLRAEDHVVDFSAGVGFRHEYTGADVLLSRFIIGRRFSSWQSYGNLILEKPLSKDRDAVDLITTAGFSYAVSPSFRLGFEVVGQDLEGFWEENEAEGGATLFIGPTVGIVVPGMPCTFTLGGGVIFHATKNARTSEVVRDLPSHQGNGFVIQNMISFGL